MGMTMAEKVLARAAGRQAVEAGEYVTAKAERVLVILDHDLPAPTEQMASRLEDGVAPVYAEGRVKTPDPGGGASTTDFCAAVESLLVS